MNILIRRNILSLVFYIISVLLLILPALAYKFPLLFSDSGTYLSSGYTGYVPVDRPIIYGLFIRYISLSWSIWIVIIFQSIIWNYLIHLFVTFTIQVKKNKGLVHLLLALFLGVFTGIGYYCSMIMADIFTSISIVSVFFLLTLNIKLRIHIVLVSILFVFSIITHLSHLPLIISLLILVGILYLIKSRVKINVTLGRLSFLAFLTLSSLLILASINYSYGVGFKVSRTNNIILATRFIESGLANQYLKKNCAKEDFTPDYKELCNYIDQFDQWPAAGFYLYDHNSPLYDGSCMERGWKACWIQKNNAYGNLIKDILSDADLSVEFIKLVFSGTIKQLFTFEQSSLHALDFENIMEKYFPNDKIGYRFSLQNRTTLLFDQSNILEVSILIVSIIYLLYFIWSLGILLSEKDRLLLILVFYSLITNAIITSTLSNVIARYQGRIIFLIPLLAFCLASKYIIHQYSLNKENPKVDK